MIYFDPPEDFVKWKDQVRSLLVDRVNPQIVQWREEKGLSLFDESYQKDSASPLSSLLSSFPRTLHLPAPFFEMGSLVAHHRDLERWSLLYRLAFRILNGEKNLLQIFVDDDVRRCQLMAKSVRREIHKMHAFVRFREIKRNNYFYYEAWYEPDHPVLKLAAPFFKRRFSDRPWIIATPEACAQYDLKTLQFTPGMSRADFHAKDSFEDLWRVYYESVSNLSRLNLRAMKKAMPVRYWQNLPEAQSIQKLVVETPSRLEALKQKILIPASPPDSMEWKINREAAKDCKACLINENAKQVIFGKGSLKPKLMIVAEQPGEDEDQSGVPFIGPSGDLLNNILNKMDVSQNSIYFTYAVKHFKWEKTDKNDGQSKINKKPTYSEMHCCQPWLKKEMQILQPKVILALGNLVSLCLLGKQIKLSQAVENGDVFELSNGTKVFVFWPLSTILDDPDQVSKNLKIERFRDIISLALNSVEEG